MKRPKILKYHITTFGCQMNRNDSERIAGILEKSGFKPAKNEPSADLVIINSCSVRQSAIDRIWGKGRQFSRARNKNKNFKVVLTGCVLPADKKRFCRMFDLIFHIKDLPKLPEMLGLKKEQKFSADYLLILPKLTSKFSGSVPIMTGCDNFCTYCAVPYTRGREVSRSVEDILADVKNLIQKGRKEIWLLGQNVNSYQFIDKKEDYIIKFADLLRMVNDIKGDFWIRFTSPHPKDFSDDLISAMAECEKVSKYLNLPIQSGDDEILKKMNRHYTAGKYAKLLERIRKKNPDIAVSTDIIVGFPGETKKQFHSTAKLMKKAEFDMAFIARFSPRPGTPAALMKDNVSSKEKERRWKELTEILKKTALKNNKKLIGTIQKVLIDEIKVRGGKKKIFGKTSGLKNVEITKGRAKPGEFVNIKIIEAKEFGLKGEIK